MSTSPQQQKLKQYTAVAGALLASTSVDAQVIAVNLNPDVVLDTTSAPYALDFNNDANPEITFAIQNLNGASSISGIAFTYAGAAGGIQLSPNVSVIGAISAGGSSSSSSFQVSALNSGDAISAAQNFGSSSQVALGLDVTVNAGILGTFPIQQGNFLGVSNKFMGAKFQIGTATHYGWVELSMAANATQLTIHGYGYQNTPDSTILAGEGGNAGLDHIALSQKVSILGKPSAAFIHITPDLMGATVQLLSTDGKVLKEQILTDISNELRYDELSTGIYLVSLQHQNDRITERVYVR
ncbi:MAG: hypothetical protein RLZZ301_261 [Bacteroidota bacterium]|jgi:hypothetical protein